MRTHLIKISVFNLECPTAAFRRTCGHVSDEDVFDAVPAQRVAALGDEHHQPGVGGLVCPAPGAFQHFLFLLSFFLE
jgi:hypothetical protein